MKKTTTICILMMALVLMVACEKKNGSMASTEDSSSFEDSVLGEDEIEEISGENDLANASDNNFESFLENSKYDEVWTTDLKTQEQIFEEGGVVLYLVYDGDCVSGQLYNVQGITKRIADISFFNEQIIDGKVSFEFDDGFGKGIIDIQIDEDLIVVKVDNYSYEQDNNTGWGTDLEYVLLKNEEVAEKLAEEDSSKDYVSDSPICGCYGEYKENHYLIISDGVEDGSFDIKIHIDDSKELAGHATIYEYPDSKEVLLFTSEDGTVKGTIDGFETDVTFYVSETDGSVVGQEEAYLFEGKN